jgi:hypothetical protein
MLRARIAFPAWLPRQFCRVLATSTASILHQQAEYEPDLFGEPHAASVSDGGGRAMTARKCGSIGLIRRYGAYTAIKRVNLAFSTCFNCFSI